jgi:hypothetical protein
MMRRASLARSTNAVTSASLTEAAAPKWTTLPIDRSAATLDDPVMPAIFRTVTRALATDDTAALAIIGSMRGVDTASWVFTAAAMDVETKRETATRPVDETPIILAIKRLRVTTLDDRIARVTKTDRAITVADVAETGDTLPTNLATVAALPDAMVAILPTARVAAADVAEAMARDFLTARELDAAVLDRTATTTS